jgi:hypothetical protein
VGMLRISLYTVPGVSHLCWTPARAGSQSLHGSCGDPSAPSGASEKVFYLT